MSRDPHTPMKALEFHGHGGMRFGDGMRRATNRTLGKGHMEK